MCKITLKITFIKSASKMVKTMHPYRVVVKWGEPSFHWSLLRKLTSTNKNCSKITWKEEIEADGWTVGLFLQAFWRICISATFSNHCFYSHICRTYAVSSMATKSQTRKKIESIALIQNSLNFCMQKCI